MILEKKTTLINNPVTYFSQDSLKIKLLSSNELLTSLDRLTRFKYPLISKNRVYEKLLLNNLISPKMSLKNINNLPNGIINQIAQIVWDESLKQITQKKVPDISLNKYLAFEEIKTFSGKKMLEEIILRKLPDIADKDFINEIKTVLEENNLIIKSKYFELHGMNIYDEIYINIQSAYPFDIASFIESIENKNTEYPFNIQRIIKLWRFIKDKNLKLENIKDFEYLYNFQIAEKSFNFALPARLLIIVEGNTEEILLPIFCEKSGLAFNSSGIQLIAAGGKNQILKIYNDIKDKISIPIFILLDKDGVDVEVPLKSIIKPKDTYFIIEEGEFEDILMPTLICRAVNNFYKAGQHINIDEINNNIPKTKLLHSLWREKGFEEFSKSSFAKIIAENIREISDISPALIKIIQKIEKICTG